MDFSIKGPGTGLRFARQRLPARRHTATDPPAESGAAAETAAVWAGELHESEQMRAAIVAVNQAIEASELAAAWVGRAGEGLREALAHARMMEQTARKAVSAGCDFPSAEVWEQLQDRWRKHRQAIDAVAEKNRFGPVQLLDGTLGCRAAAFGRGLELVRVADGVRSSPPEGYEILISQEPTRPTLLGDLPLTEPEIAHGIALALEVDGHRAEVQAAPGRSPEAVAADLQAAAKQASLPVSVQLGPGSRLLVQHARLGSHFRILAESSVPGVLSNLDGKARIVSNGKDVGGTLHGEPGLGRGQILTGCPDNRFTPGLAVSFRPWLHGGAPGWKYGKLAAGRVLISQQRLRLRWDGADAAHLALRLDPVRCADLGRGEDGADAVVCLADTTTLPRERADAAVAAIGRAREQLEATLREVLEAGELALPAHLSRLRVQAQNLAAASHAITAPQLAMDAVRTLVRGLRIDGDTPLTIQNSVPPKAMLRLLDGELTGDEVLKLN